ncbi:HEPN domain-containing protein [Halorubrum sp. Atlit-26R]|mgnify:CR=1 FL=1|uniref:ApeA N-terminal domain 1-containing protein n=1 Tax=Halorubrum sp. Atlit-26R TaxID=2282128 RepID=UPI0011C48814|nr:HEPN domain-containing protein [Halorubrum sp. Atlit-26R]
MFDRREFEGYWWTPESEDRKVPGTLEYDPDTGITLRLLSTLKKEGNIPKSDSTATRYDRILGKTTEEENITLIDCPLSKTSGIGGAKTEQYIANELLIGHCFTDSIEFSRIQIKSDLIDAWAERPATSFDSSVLERADGKGPVKGQVGDTFEIKGETLETLDAEVEIGTVKLKNNITTNLRRRGGGEITDKCFFEIVFQSGAEPYEVSLDYVKKIEDFVTLALGEECWAEQLIGIGTDGDTEIEILYPPQETPKEASKIHPYKTNFILPDISDNYESVIQNWFDISNRYSQSLNLYFSTRYNNRMYVNNEFFSLVQSIEVYHRRNENFDGIYVDPEEFEDYYDELCETVRSDFDNSFSQHLKKGSFKYANEYSLAKRMDELVQRVTEDFEELPLEFESNIRPIVNARNNLTHEGDAGVSTAKLFDFSQVLKALLESLILIDIGINKDQIQDRLSQRYENLI